jgi:hypothetical protein
LVRLPDGREALMLGDPEASANYRQDAELEVDGFGNISGLVLCDYTLRQLGVDVGMQEILRHAAGNGLCDVREDAVLTGSASLDSLARVLTDFGVPAHLECGQSLEELVQCFESGVGVLVAVDVDDLWGSSSAAGSQTFNHMLAITAVAREPGSGESVGLYAYDPVVRTPGPDPFIDAPTMQRAWNSSGGWVILTDLDGPIEAEIEPPHDR